MYSFGLKPLKGFVLTLKVMLKDIHGVRMIFRASDIMGNILPCKMNILMEHILHNIFWNIDGIRNILYIVG